MTIPVSARRMPPYAGNGVTTSFAYNFYISADSELLIVEEDDVTEARSTLVLDTDYTVTGVGAEVGGNVVLTDPLATGKTLYVIGNTPLTQPTDFKNQSSWQGKRVESSLDRIEGQIQELSSLALKADDRVSLDYDAGGRNIIDIGGAYVDELYIGGVLVVPEDMAFSLPDPAGNANEFAVVNSLGTAYETKTHAQADVQKASDIQSGQAGATKFVPTVAAMKALTGLVDGAQVQTGCYTVAGKGAGRYRASTTVVTENGGTIINNNAGTISFHLIHNGEVESVQFGALHDGVTDDSAEISALFLAASTEGFVPVISKGTAIASNITGQSNINVKGMGYGVSVIKRPASSPNNNSIMDFAGKENFSLSGFTMDGNKASQSNAANNLTVSGCKKYKIAIESNNAKAVSGGFGDGIILIDGTNDSAVEKSSVEGCHGSGNDSNGLSVNKEWYLNILNNKFNSNGSQGIFVANYVFPPVENSQNSLTINGNHCHFNASGIYVLGYYTGGSAVAPHYGSSTPQSRYFEISGNHCNFNDIYGIVYQGDAGAVYGNHCSRNGDLEAFGAGYLLNCSNTSFNGNTGRDNGFYGVDAGGSTNLIISNNNFISNGVTSGFGCTDINIGACRTTQVINNTITQSGSVASTAISCAGIDGDGSTPFNQVASENFINGNIITLNSNTNSIGVYAYRNSGILYVIGNHVKYPSSAKAYVLESTQVVQSDNKETADFSGGTTSQQLASAATLVIPDQGDSFLISGTTNITSIRTYSSNVYDGKVRDVRMTNNGTGYTSAPTVGFSGGGGTGAAATAELSHNGTIIGVNMTNNGSGYTSAPTVSFTGGGGSAAAGTALVGCNNFGGRVIRLHFLATLTVTDGSNLILAGNLSAVAGTTLTLRGEFGNWYEVSRSVN